MQPRGADEATVAAAKALLTSEWKEREKQYQHDGSTLQAALLAAQEEVSSVASREAAKSAHLASFWASGSGTERGSE